VTQNLKADAITFAVHGSRVYDSNLFVVDLIADLSAPIPINVGFLEIAQPTLFDALTAHIKAGKKNIRVIPYFLAPGKHSMQDIPSVVGLVVTENPGSVIHIDPLISEQALFKKLLNDLI
jgi:sirohydrochlorin ferrochelatase